MYLGLSWDLKRGRCLHFLRRKGFNSRGGERGAWLATGWYVHLCIHRDRERDGQRCNRRPCGLVGTDGNEGLGRGLTLVTQDESRAADRRLAEREAGKKCTEPEHTELHEASVSEGGHSHRAGPVM